MSKAMVRFALLALLLPILLQANHILRNDLLKLQVTDLIEGMGNELEDKTGVHAYVIATNEHFPERFNLVKYSKQYEANLSKPYVLLIFAPFATVTEKSGARGRMGIIPSSPELKKLYDYDAVRDAGVDVIAMKDSNKMEDKINIGVLQSYSELADDIAHSKGIKLTKTIPNEVQPVVRVLKIIVYIGTIIVLWMFIFRPLLERIRNGKE